MSIDFNNHLKWEKEIKKQKPKEINDLCVKWELAVQELKSNVSSWLSDSINAGLIEVKDQPFGNCENIVINKDDNIVCMREVRFENINRNRFEMFHSKKDTVFLEYNFEKESWEFRNLKKRFSQNKKLDRNLFLNLLKEYI
ncbi:hypothetical protein [Halobacillus seohaensis]|uniref:Uncharacterized protein n=1 Tax=Halobacillus seohaensis TaxID=447421 RepID=A0ABW2EFU8_9BACI